MHIIYCVASRMLFYMPCNLCIGWIWRVHVTDPQTMCVPREVLLEDLSGARLLSYFEWKPSSFICLPGSGRETWVLVHRGHGDIFLSRRGVKLEILLHGETW